MAIVTNTEAKFPAAVIAAQYRNCAQAVAWGSSFEVRRKKMGAHYSPPGERPSMFDL
jgi:hypothetical protein